NKQINIKPPNIEQIKQIAQKQQATFVEYSVIDKSQLYIWVIKPTGEVAFKQVDIKSLDTPLAKLVKNSRVSIGARGRSLFSIETTDEVKQNQNSQKQNLQQLHKLLIQPIASHLPRNPDERVIFIPHKSLFLVPFPALLDKSGKYLIEKHTIMTSPAIQVLELTNKNNQEKLNLTSLQPKDLLVVGNPTMPIVGIPPTQLSKLPGAEKEALAIAKLFNTTPLIGNQATKSAVVQKISSARVIHFATHGLLDGKDFGELTPGALAFAPDTLTPLSSPLSKEGKIPLSSPLDKGGKIPLSSPLDKGGKRGVVNEGLLKSTEIIDMKLNADLVVLSACDTGRGEIKGEGVIGLSRSLITAGASSVIVSLWKIPDNSTSQLIWEGVREGEIPIGNLRVE
ncbi:MAG: CHAT domain-containing protein, partial [Cyanobacteria bacterium J06635_10]